MNTSFETSHLLENSNIKRVSIKTGCMQNSPQYRSKNGKKNIL